jgi:hypothetical protein
LRTRGAFHLRTLVKGALIMVADNGAGMSAESKGRFYQSFSPLKVSMDPA